MKKFNLNQTIKVKLKPEGVNIFYHQHDDLIERGIITERRMPKIDENGYTEMQFWVFMNLYANTHKGSVFPFHMEILIDEDKLYD